MSELKETVYVVVENTGEAAQDLDTFNDLVPAEEFLKALATQYILSQLQSQKKFGGNAGAQKNYAAALVEKNFAGDSIDVGPTQLRIEERETIVPEAEPLTLGAPAIPGDEKIELMLAGVGERHEDSTPEYFVTLPNLGKVLADYANVMNEGCGHTFYLTLMVADHAIESEGDFTVSLFVEDGARVLAVNDEAIGDSYELFVSQIRARYERIVSSER